MLTSHKMVSFIYDWDAAPMQSQYSSLKKACMVTRLGPLPNVGNGDRTGD